MAADPASERLARDAPATEPARDGQATETPQDGPAKETLSCLLDQRFDVDGLYQLRAAVSAHSADLGLLPSQANDVVIAVHELAANSVRHGPGRGRVRIWASPRALVCEVADGELAQHAGSAWLATTAGTAELPWPVEPGHGLWLVNQVADEIAVRYDASGLAVTATFAINRPR